MNSTDLTIAIATYNGERFVAEAVTSALATGARVVVSDDNSTDGTRDILEGYRSAVKLIYQTINIGIAGQYQALLEACTTPLALLLNQDDLLFPAIVTALPVNATEVTVMNGWVIDEMGSRLRPIYRRPPLHATVGGVYAGLLVENFVRSPSQVVFPPDRARRAGGFLVGGDAGQGAEDWMCWLRLAAAGLPFKLRCRPAMCYRVHEGNYSRNGDSLAASRASVRDNLPSAPNYDRRLALRW